MTFTDLIFDLYGTLVDIHTEETPLVWEKCALFFRFHGAHYSGEALSRAFGEELHRRQALRGQSYECYPDIPFEQILQTLFCNAGVTENTEALAFSAAQLFRICSIEYLRLYPGVVEALTQLRRDGYRLWLLSNAQQVFTAYEMRSLGMDGLFDGVYLSSDFLCRKPDTRFLGALLQEHDLRPENCLMIGNDRDTDILGARQLGLATLYLHTPLTPREQTAADPALHPAVAPKNCRNFEIEGFDWPQIVPILENTLLFAPEGGSAR